LLHETSYDSPSKHSLTVDRRSGDSASTSTAGSSAGMCGECEEGNLSSP